MREAARSQATRSGRVPQSAIDEQLKSFDDKDLRLRSVGKDVRKREARRRLMDIDIKAKVKNDDPDWTELPPPPPCLALRVG